MISDFCQSILQDPNIEFDGAVDILHERQMAAIAAAEEAEAKLTPEERAAIKAEEERRSIEARALWYKEEPVRKLEDYPGTTMAEKRLAAMMYYNRLRE